MDAKEVLENIADSYGWGFVYARRDYQNLHDAVQFIADGLEGHGAGGTVMFADPITRARESGGTRYSGNFMVITKSDMDDSYEGKSSKSIGPIVEIAMDGLVRKLRCHYTILGWSVTEVVDVFDFNGDGVSVRFNLQG